MSILYKVKKKTPITYHGEVDRKGTFTVRYETTAHASLEMAASQDIVLFTVRTLGRRIVFVAETPAEILETIAYLRTVGFTFSTGENK